MFTVNVSLASTAEYSSNAAESIKDLNPNAADILITSVITSMVTDLGVVSPTASGLLTFYDGEMLPKKYKNTIFMALHGSWNRTRKSGYKILAAHFDDQGELIGYEDFITGWLQREGTKETVLGRPANVFQMQDGSLLISDDKANAIFRVSY